MQIEPLPKKLYDRAISAGITTITLNFSGGSDEGYLNISLNNGSYEHRALEDEIENWAWEVYEYSGAGDGTGDYGDDIVYDLNAMKATHNDWCMERHDGEETDTPFELSEEDEDELILENSTPTSPVELMRELARLDPDLQIPPALRAIIEKAKQLTEEGS